MRCPVCKSSLYYTIYTPTTDEYDYICDKCHTLFDKNEVVIDNGKPSSITVSEAQIRGIMSDVYDITPMNIREDQLKTALIRLCQYLIAKER